MDQLKEAKKLTAVSSSNIEQAKNKISFLKKELKEKEPKAKKAAKANQAVVKEIELAKAEVSALKVSIVGEALHIFLG